ncbi:hypothetical protein [Microbacterium stercoris]|uniref:Uncharacterized protein n=1 Tax=Microbacterium stercoris TaxID=2820289 RepID=A0A939QKC8_9MICO|nr:hypothetical protein [Microbacterium stercoris]MBO3663740.1 hypothetical protein [Microbacterium stercoris]
MVSRPRPDRPEDAIWRILERLDRLETAANLRSASVHDGQTRFVGNESILVQGSGKVEGWWIVTGTQRVTGRLEGSGTLDWTGPWALSGDGDITGSVDITGILRLLSDLNVEGGGEINVGGIKLTPLGGGRIQVGGDGGIIIDSASKSITIPGTNPITIKTEGGVAKIDLGVADVISNGDQAGIVAGNYWVGAENGSAFVGQSGGSMFVVIGGQPKVRGTLAPGSGVGAVTALGVDEADNLVRMTSPV